MRKTLFRAAAPLLLTLPGTASSAPSPAPWRISEISGDVALSEGGRERAAVKGALLSSGSAIATGSSGRAVIVRGKEFVIVSPRSRVRVPVAAQSRGGLMQMISDLGTAVFRIEKKSTPHFGVRTPFLAAVVKGTTFSVAVSSGGATVQVTEGAVEVSTSDEGAAEIIRPGSVASVSANDLFAITIKGDENKVVRSRLQITPEPSAQAPAGATVPPGGATGEAKLAMASIDDVMAEESLFLQTIAAGLSLSIPSAETVLAALGDEEIATADHARGDNSTSAGSSSETAPSQVNAFPTTNPDRPDDAKAGPHNSTDGNFAGGQAGGGLDLAIGSPTDRGPSGRNAQPGLDPRPPIATPGEAAGNGSYGSDPDADDAGLGKAEADRDRHGDDRRDKDDDRRGDDNDNHDQDKGDSHRHEHHNRHDRDHDGGDDGNGRHDDD